MATTSEIPPLGITYEGKLVHAVSGGESAWLPYDKVKHYTNAFIRQDGKASFTISVLCFRYKPCSRA